MLHREKSQVNSVQWSPTVQLINDYINRYVGSVNAVTVLSLFFQLVFLKVHLSIKKQSKCLITLQLTVQNVKIIFVSFVTRL